jgi:hypothetical protein
MMRKSTIYAFLCLTFGVGFVLMTRGDFARLENSANTPGNLEESLAELDRILPPSRKLMIRMSNDSDMVGYHRGLGMTLRNQWGLWKGSKLSKFFNDRGIHHPDYMSGIILKSYWRHLHNQPIQLEREIVYYQTSWEKVKQAAAWEKAEAPKRIKRVQNAMMNWTYQEGAAPTAILPKQHEFPGIWKLEPYRGGFLVVTQGFKGLINETFSHIWHNGIYFVASSNAPMQPVRKPGCGEIHDVVTQQAITYWLCKNQGRWRLLAENTDQTTEEIQVNLPSPWLRLGTSKDSIFLMSQKSIYQLVHGQWVEKFTRHHLKQEFSPFDQDPPWMGNKLEWTFPRKGDTPRIIDQHVYLWARDYGNESGLWRLDMRQPEAELEPIREFLTQPYYGNWEAHAGQILPTSQNTLWVTLSQDSLVAINPNSIQIPIYGGDIKFNGIIGTLNSDIKKKNNISVRAIYEASNNIIYLAGLKGIFQVQKGMVQPVVHFQFPPGVDPEDHEEGYRRTIQPQKLARFEDGTFLIGDANNGLYRLQKGGDGGWTLILLHQQIGNELTLGPHTSPNSGNP